MNIKERTKLIIMNKFIMSLLMAFLPVISLQAQSLKVYDETIDPFEQIDNAVARAAADGKFVVCQLGGNWCPWCLRFAKFISEDTEIAQTIADNYEYIHVNIKSRDDELSQKVSKRLGNAARFGFPVLVVLRGDGTVLHIQNSAYLEDGESYSRSKVLEFFQQWTPKAVGE